MKFYKYQGAGNDFLLMDGRNVQEDVLSQVRAASYISFLCDRRYGIGADGLMILMPGEPGYDFRMEYYNSDGSGGMMCGNGGRCIVAFAADLGFASFRFTAADGPHVGEVLSKEGRCRIVRIGMKDVTEVQDYAQLSCGNYPGTFLETGTRHYVHMVKDVEAVDVRGTGALIRNCGEFAPVGANVNFVQDCGGRIKVRTFEKGVEDETFACGTGIVASCLAAYRSGLAASAVDADGRVHYDVRARRDDLSVDFLPGQGEYVAQSVYLTGPATSVACLEL